MFWKLCNIRWSCKDCTFQVYTIFFPKPLIWINFHNPQFGTNTQIKYLYIYKEFLINNKKRMSIEQKNC
jgi:hypothetical protein